MTDEQTVPLSWVVVFALLALGLGLVAVRYTGGSVLPTVVPA
ncbi:MAG: hypothetical protein ABEJ30_06470 [Halorientalis sp.]